LAAHRTVHCQRVLLLLVHVDTAIDPIAHQRCHQGAKTDTQSQVDAKDQESSATDDTCYGRQQILRDTVLLACCSMTSELNVRSKNVLQNFPVIFTGLEAIDFQQRNREIKAILRTRLISP
jgi:hypothetical protein